MISFAEKANEEFWQKAEREFELKIGKNKSLLTSISVEISRNSRKMFKAAAVKSGHEKTAAQLAGIQSGISADDLLKTMFSHIKKIMR